jgi:hypothetical protein
LCKKWETVDFCAKLAKFRHSSVSTRYGERWVTTCQNAFLLDKKAKLGNKEHFVETK